jgi:hypothetical protein
MVRRPADRGQTVVAIEGTDFAYEEVKAAIDVARMKQRVECRHAVLRLIFGTVQMIAVIWAAAMILLPRYNRDLTFLAGCIVFLKAWLVILAAGGTSVLIAVALTALDILRERAAR